MKWEESCIAEEPSPITLTYFGAFKEIHGTLRALQSTLFHNRRRTAIKCF